MKRFAHAVLVGLTFLFGGIAGILAFIPGLLMLAFASLADLLEEEPLPYVPSPPDYESDWKVVVEENPSEAGIYPGDISVYRNGSRYTTPRSLEWLKYSGTGAYFDIIPREVWHELELKLEVVDLIREWERACIEGSRAWLDQLRVDSIKVLEARRERGPLEEKLDRFVKWHTERLVASA